MLKFLSLGSGSSGNCYLLLSDNGCVMIDAGISVKMMKRHLRTFGMSLDDVDAVFITHDHADHIKAVGCLANEMDKPVYATQIVHEGINRNYCVVSKLTSQHIRYVSKNETVSIGDFTVTPFEVPHDSSDCVGYRVESGGIVFCLATDVGHVTDIIRKQVSDANYLVLEANHDENMLMMGKYPAYLKGRIRGDKGHLCNKETAMLLAESATPKLKHVWLCHLSEENNHPELVRKTVESVLKEYGILVGVDFQMDILKRKMPSCVFELT